MTLRELINQLSFWCDYYQADEKQVKLYELAEMSGHDDHKFNIDTALFDNDDIVIYPKV